MPKLPTKVPLRRPRRHMLPAELRRKLLRGAAAGGIATGAAASTVTSIPGFRRELRRLRVLYRRFNPTEPGPPILPPVPPGHIVLLPGRGEIFVRDTGPREGAPTVLLLHGWTASADLNFFTAYEELSERYRVVAVDHRGHGRGIRSTEPFRLEDCADDAAEVLRQRGVSSAIVLGYSMGGPIALLLAQRHPELVVGLVSQATALEWSASAYERLVWRGLALWELGRRLGMHDAMVERVVGEAMELEPQLEPYGPWLIAEFKRGMMRWLVEAGYALSEFDARPFIKTLGKPAVVCVTTRDRLVRPHKQRQLAEALDAPVIELPGDHGVTLIRGERYSRVTRMAVDRVAQAAGLGPKPPRATATRKRTQGRRPVSTPEVASAN